MKFKPSPVPGAVARLFLLSAAVLCAGAVEAAVPSAPLAISNKVTLDTGNSIAFTSPAAAVGPDHNIHIVAEGMNPGLGLDTCRNNGHECNLYYLLVSPSGKVLIRASRINASDPAQHGRPQIAVTSTGKAVITWGGSNELTRYAVVDPGKQGALNGSSLNPQALVTPETEIGTNAEGHQALVLDSKNIAYVLRNTGTSNSDGPLTFLKFDPATGTVLHAESGLGTTSSHGRTFPTLALDAKGNLHVVYAAADISSGKPAAYMMLDPNGNVLIGQTQLYNSIPGLHPHVQRQHMAVMVDSSGIVNIVYGDKRNTPDANDFCNNCATGGTSVYTRLDPSKVPHDGNPSTAAALRVGKEVEIPGFWYGRAFMGGDKLIHLIAGLGKTGSFAHVAFDPRYGAIALKPVIHTGSTMNGLEYGPKYIAGTGNEVVWTESVLDGTTLRIVMAPISSFY